MIVCWLLFKLPPRIVAAVLVVLIVILAASIVQAVLKSGILGPPEAVVMRNETARFAPAYSALKSFGLPKDTVVQTFETSGKWTKISHGKKRGWIPANSLADMDQLPYLSE